MAQYRHINGHRQPLSSDYPSLTALHKRHRNGCPASHPTVMTSEEFRSVTKLLAMVINTGWITSGGTSTCDAWPTTCPLDAHRDTDSTAITETLAGIHSNKPFIQDMFYILHWLKQATARKYLREQTYFSWRQYEREYNIPI